MAAMTVSRRTVLVQLNSLELGGSQINAIDLAAALSAHGVATVLVGFRPSLPDGPSLLDLAAERDVRVEIAEWNTTTRGRARILSQLADRHDVDLVHSYGAWNGGAVYWGPCRLGRRPFVMTVYEMTVPSSVYRHPDLVVGAQYLIEELSDRPGPVHLVSPPVDFERDNAERTAIGPFLDAHGLRKERLRVVIVSRLDEDMKALGIEQAIRAVGQLNDPALDLVIVGTGDARARLHELSVTVNTGLGRRAVVLTGPMADPRPAYASADIVLGMGGSAARGLAFGKPLIVMGQHGWFGTFTSQNAKSIFRTSFWSDTRTSDPVRDLVGQLRQLLDDPVERARLSAYGRQFATEHFGLDAMAARLAAVYENAERRYRMRQWLLDWQVDAASAVSLPWRRLHSYVTA
jgi:glycosyltransferase involved in cell wall biosynthesis